MHQVPPERHAFGIGNLIAGHRLAKQDARRVDPILDRAAEGRHVIVADRTSTARCRGEQRVVCQRWRKSCRRRRACMTIDASSRPGRQRAIVVAQVRGHRMLSVEYRAPQVGGFTFGLRTRRRCHHGKGQSDRGGSRHRAKWPRHFNAPAARARHSARPSRSGRTACNSRGPRRRDRKECSTDIHPPYPP